MLGQLTGVDAVYTGNFFLLKPLSQRTVGLPVGMIIGIILGHNGAAMDMITFVIFTDVVSLPTRGNAVVTENRISGHEDLSFVGGVGQTLRITGHSGVKHNFTGGRSLIAEGFPLKGCAVFKNQDGALKLSHGVDELCSYFGVHCNPSAKLRFF